VGKSIVIGVLEHGVAECASQIRTKVIPNTRAQTVQGEVRENVEPGSVVNTDALASYVRLAPDYIHEAGDHAVEFVRGNGLALSFRVDGSVVVMLPFDPLETFMLRDRRDFPVLGNHPA
jgi:hypothetical protein